MKLTRILLLRILAAGALAVALVLTFFAYLLGGLNGDSPRERDLALLLFLALVAAGALLPLRRKRWSAALLLGVLAFSGIRAMFATTSLAVAWPFWIAIVAAALLAWPIQLRAATPGSGT